MNDPRNHELSRLYREGAWPEPSQQLDDAILEASRRAARARRSKSLVWRFGPPFALAATVVLTFTLLLRTYEEQPQLFTAPPVAKRHPAPAAVAHPAEPKPEPAVQPALNLNAVPAPAAAPALKKEAPSAARADSLQRGFEPLESPVTREAEAPARAPQTPMEKAPAPRFETAPAQMNAPQSPAAAPGAGVVSGNAGGVAAAVSARAVAAFQGTPDAWLEEIRRLKAQGRSDDVRLQLAEFRKRYPDYPLPDDLR